MVPPDKARFGWSGGLVSNEGVVPRMLSLHLVLVQGKLLSLRFLQSPVVYASMLCMS